jgi:hypothetical protein
MHSITEWNRLAAFVLLAFVLANGKPAQAQDIVKLSLCDVFGSLEASSGKLVAIHAEVSIGRHAHALIDRNCKVRVETPGHRWPTALYLGGKPSAEAISQAQDISDSRSVEFFYALANLMINHYVLQEPIMAPPFEISGTFVGELHTHTQDYWASHGPRGFGDQNFYPAELSLIAVKELVITELPSK